MKYKKYNEKKKTEKVRKADLSLGVLEFWKKRV